MCPQGPPIYSVGCELCQEFQVRTFAFDHSISSRLIVETDTVLVFPTLGCFEEGYVLVSPRRHVVSTASLPIDEFDDVMSTVADVRKRVTKHYGPTCIFEHGMGRKGEAAGGCIEHAHLHIIPRAEIVGPSLLSSVPFHTRISWAALNEWSGRPYLLLSCGDQEDAWITDPPEGLRSQHFRRAAAEALGVGDSYDWAADYGIDKIGATIERLK